MCVYLFDDVPFILHHFQLIVSLVIYLSRSLTNLSLKNCSVCVSKIYCCSVVTISHNARPAQSAGLGTARYSSLESTGLVFRRKM